ncbi:MAG: hypothetical protein ACPGZP_00260 [Panacagrimonas sp.]
MLLFRLLLLIAALLLVWRVWVLIRKHRLSGGDAQTRSFQPTARCRICGVYLPIEALSQDQRCGACNQTQDQ